MKRSKQEWRCNEANDNLVKKRASTVTSNEASSRQAQGFDAGERDKKKHAVHTFVTGAPLPSSVNKDASLECCHHDIDERACDNEDDTEDEDCSSSSSSSLASFVLLSALCVRE